eukprot:7581754-Alexandrium_andersonii.AAC.1
MRGSQVGSRNVIAIGAHRATWRELQGEKETPNEATDLGSVIVGAAGAEKLVVSSIAPDLATH